MYLPLVPHYTLPSRLEKPSPQLYFPPSQMVRFEGNALFKFFYHELRNSDLAPDTGRALGVFGGEVEKR
jgi:hypothetical protein